MNSNELYKSAEVEKAVSSAMIHLKDTIAVEMSGEHIPEHAADSVIAWPVIYRILSSYGVPHEVRMDILGLISRKAYYAGEKSWRNGYGHGWDAALKTWGLNKCV